nr:hypothetical protein [Saprospiraceae bacterium]
KANIDGFLMEKHEEISYNTRMLPDFLHPAPPEQERTEKEISRFDRLAFAEEWPGEPVPNQFFENQGIIKPNGRLLKANGITLQTGVERRYIAEPHITSLDLAMGAIKKLSHPYDAQWLIVAYSHPTGVHHANTIKEGLGLYLPEDMTFDINGACSGGPYALTKMKDNEALFWHKTGILGFGETYQKHVENMSMNGIKHDASLAQTLFTDGGFALQGTYGKDFTVMHYKNQPFSELGYAICMPVDRARMVPPFYAPVDIPYPQSGTFEQDGPAVVNAVKDHVAPLVATTIEEYGLSNRDIVEIFPHQGSKPIYDAFIQGLPDAYKGLVHPDYADGNFSSGSTFKGLMKSIKAGRVKAGDTVVLAGFGAGMYASIVILKLGYQFDKAAA